MSDSDALARLLGDDDPETVRLVKEQLAASGDEELPRLRQLAESDDDRVSVHAREVLDEIEARNSQDEFGLLCAFFPDDGDLETSLWGLSRALLPGVDWQAYRQKLDMWGRQLAIRCESTISSRERVMAMSRFLAEELGFRGNTDEYYEERNSLLPTVIETRLGIPISLATVYILVGARAGLAVHGINLPGHFIARHEGILFDPFHRGKMLTRADCEEILRRQNLRLEDSHLQAATAKQILTRALTNLLYLYDLKSFSELHELVHSWLSVLRADALAKS